MQKLKSSTPFSKKRMLLPILFIDSLFTGQQCILHERYNGHGTHTTRNRSYKSAFGCNFIKPHVTRQLES